MLFTRRPDPGRPPQTSRREDHHIKPLCLLEPYEGHLGSQRPVRALPLTPTHQGFRLEWGRARENWTAVEWNEVIFSDESRFNLSSNDHRFRVWRPHGECLNPAFALQQHTAPTVGGMVWVAIAYNTLLPLVLICGTMRAQRFVPNRPYLGLFGTTSLASHEFELTKGKATANREQNVSRHHTELICLNTRPYRIVHSR
ncbi:transposable element Tcb1 transposase [Trichonephila clavipes]|nr:transposable element Tcb1 transposase [Trichonephila clavipes]